MKIQISPQLVRFLGHLRAHLGPRLRGVCANGEGSWKLEEIRDIDTVVETFNGLIAQLCHDGGQLGELYAKAERRAARYALLSETVVDSVTSGILVIADTGDITLANGAARRILRVPEGTDLTGKRFAEILADPSELQTLVAQTFKQGLNTSRHILGVTTRDGRRLCLGASASCVASPSRVEVVIVVFTELAPSRHERVDAPAAADASQATYLRGVLDCYDYFSSVAREVERVQGKIEKGSLGTSDLADCIGHTRRAWEIMSAFALSLVARDSLNEQVDAGSVLGSIVARRKELSRVTVSQTINGLLLVATVRKVFEAGLELLLLGCAEDTSADVLVDADVLHDVGGDAVQIKIVERSPRSHVLKVGESLREFKPETGMRREAGLMLLRSLSRDNRVLVDEGPDRTVFRLAIPIPIDGGTGPAAERGDISGRGPDGK